MVTSALYLNDKCCFDFGNAETNSLDTRPPHGRHQHMCHDTPCKPDSGLDMEDGIYEISPSRQYPFVTVLGASDGQHAYAIYQGNAQSGALTSTGVIPSQGLPAMKQEGAILLGIGGDNSNWATGYFFEGVMTTGMPALRPCKPFRKTSSQPLRRHPRPEFSFPPRTTQQNRRRLAIREPPSVLLSTVDSRSFIPEVRPQSRLPPATLRQSALVFAAGLGNLRLAAARAAHQLRHRAHQLPG